MPGIVADPNQLAAAGQMAQSPELWSAIQQAPTNAQYAEPLPDREQLSTADHIKAWPNIKGFFHPEDYSTPTMKPLTDAGKSMAQQVLSQYAAGDPRVVDELTKLATHKDLLDEKGNIDRHRLEHELMYQAVNDRIGHRMFDDPTNISPEQMQELKNRFNFDSSGVKFPFEVLDQGAGNKKFFVPGK